MFEAMRFAALLHKVKTGDPRAVPATTALEMATIQRREGAGAGEARLARSKPESAPISSIVSTPSARMTPLYDPVSHLVYAAHGEDVRTVMVNGRVLMRDRKMLTLDEPAVLAEARKFAEGSPRSRRASDLFLDADEGQMPELSGVVEAVSDDELVLDLESDIFRPRRRPCGGSACSAGRRYAGISGRARAARPAGSCSVRPVSTMSSTIMTSRPWSGVSRSLSSRTSPELFVAAP